MIKKLLTLFKLGRKLAKSDILNIISKFKEPPLAIKILFKILSFSFSNTKKVNLNVTEGEKLSKSLQSMGTTFIKLGQFLVTRPDIIGDELAKELEGLQDRLPAFSLSEAKAIIKKDLGEETFNTIIDLSEPIAAASIAQVHKAKINDNGIIKDVAIKILRPDIKKIFNEEIDAIMLFAFFVESLIKKTKRLKLIEVVFLLKEITNLEMDLRFEAAAANEYGENTKNDEIYTVDLAFKYRGMGHILIMFYNRKTGQFLYRYDGGSNGYDREYNYNRLKNYIADPDKYLDIYEEYQITNFDDFLTEIQKTDEYCE